MPGSTRGSTPSSSAVTIRHGMGRPAPAGPLRPPAPEAPSGPVPSDGARQPDEPGRLDREVAHEEGEAPRRNPYRVILLLVSLAAIAGAAALLWKRIAEDPYGGFGGYGGDTGQVFLQQFIDSLMVPLLTGGLLGLCLWFALGALRRPDDG